MNEVGIVIGTFGDQEWFARGVDALISLQEQTIDAPRVHIHEHNLQMARNHGAMHLRDQYAVENLIFLDADDRLDPHYVEEMLKGAGDVRQPSTIGMYSDGHMDDEANLIEPAKELFGGLLHHNHLVIGSMVRAELFFEVGMFNDLPVLEDWDLWIRCMQAGADITTVPKAIYRVGVNEGSRNNQANLHGQVAMRIRQKYGRSRGR